MTFSPVTESLIRGIQSKAVARQEKREKTAAKIDQRQNDEQRSCLSPNDIIARERHIAACKYWENVYKQEQEREHHKKRNAAIAEMKVLYEEWQKPETAPTRRGYILRTYGEMYRRWEPKPGTTTDEAILKYWESERLKAMRKKVYGATK